jgi:DNA processing protein
VLAVPGEITSSLSAGTNALLKLGAVPCTSADDVLELFGLDRVVASQQTVDGPAKDMLAALPAAPDDVARTPVSMHG